MARSDREIYLNITVNALGTKYEFIDCDKDNLCNFIGQGGSGIVYSAKQFFGESKKIFSKRAIKFFMFRDDLMKDWGYVSADNFDTEIKNISRFNHQNILKVIDGDYYNVIIDNESCKIPYTITEFIEGPNLENIFEATNLELCSRAFRDEETIFELFSQILDGIIYLHNNNFYHCDIAPKNIFLKSDDNNFFAVIGDLGAGKTISPKSFETTKIIGTKKYMPGNVVERKNKEVSYEEFCKLQPYWDIYSTIESLKEIIDNIRKRNPSATEFWNLDRLYEKFCENVYSNIQDIKHDIDNLRPSSNQILKLDELSEASKNIVQVLIPIDCAYLSKRMRKLSKHDMLLRLMEVPQLLEGATTFPGANHTRYEHSLGTYELMRRAMLSLLRNKEYAKFLSEKYVITGLIAALLSSLYNFPYSYAINELQSQESSMFLGLEPQNVFKQFINKKSTVTDKSIADCINDLFNDYHINIEDIEYVIFGNQGKRKEELEVLHSLLNSSIGVRVLDYMMRDSHHIGLTYKIDTNSLFKSLSIYDKEFCIRQPGVTTVEQIISNRYWLFKRIYWSDPNRANAALLKHLFFMLHNSEFVGKLIENIHDTTKREIQKLVLECVDDNARKSIEYSIKFLNQKGQERYKSILVLDKESKYPHASDICNGFAKMDYSRQHNIRDQVEKALIEEYSIPEVIVDCGVAVLVDMPYERQGNKIGNDIRVLRYDNSYLELKRASGIVEGIKTSFEDQLMLLRVFVRPDIYELLINSRKIDRADIESFLCKKLYEYCI